MKRLFGILMLLAILLCGCSSTEPQQTDATSASSASEPTQTEVVCPQYAPQTVTIDSSYTAVAAMGSDLLLYGQDKLAILDGQTLQTVATAEISGLPNPGNSQLQVRADGVAYYDAQNKDMVFLGTNLKETMRLHLPEDLIGTACLSSDWSKVFYCTQSEIRALDMNTGVSRLVKEHAAVWQSVTGVLLEDTVIRCMEKTADGSIYMVLLSAQSGELLAVGDYLSTMHSEDSRYYLTIDHGSVTEMLFGTTSGKVQNLWAKTEPTDIRILPQRNAFVTVAPAEEGICAEYYDLFTGKRTASLTLTQQKQILGAVSGGEGIVWLHCSDAVYRWDLTQSQIQDDTVYVTEYYDRENKNTQGLAQVKIEAYRLAQKYGVEIIIGEDAAGLTPWDYTFETEYIPQAYEKALVTLEKTLSRFPETFFAQVAEKSTNQKMNIVLVRGIYGSAEKGSLASAGGSQYWKDGTLYMALRLGETLEAFFYHEMAHAIDTKVLSTSTAFYEWEKLNPADFQYDNAYTVYKNRQDDKYLTDGDRCFVDSYAMSFAIEDRARILEYACMPGNAHYFQTEVMQKKLQRVCNGIRETFGLEDNKQRFIWEQYLNT